MSEAVALTNVVELETERTCTKCKHTLPISSFALKGPKFKWRYRTCKKCTAMKQWAQAKRRPEAIRNSRYKCTYGVTLDQVKQMLESQSGLCANRACGTDISIEVKKSAKNKAFVDHCHETGKVRGLLCISCNTSLGLLEQKNKMIGLTEYLHRSK